jgi:hypothetical protein
VSGQYAASYDGEGGKRPLQSKNNEVRYKITLKVQYQNNEAQDKNKKRSIKKTRPKPSDFSGEKMHSMPFFGGEVKPPVPCSRFAACKRTL